VARMASDSSQRSRHTRTRLPTRSTWSPSLWWCVVIEASGSRFSPSTRPRPPACRDRSRPDSGTSRSGRPPAEPAPRRSRYWPCGRRWLGGHVKLVDAAGARRSP
jgi:hypothetical protein